MKTVKPTHSSGVPTLGVMKAVFLSLEFNRGLQATVPQEFPAAENKIRYTLQLLPFYLVTCNFWYARETPGRQKGIRWVGKSGWSYGSGWFGKNHWAPSGLHWYSR